VLNLLEEFNLVGNLFKDIIRQSLDMQLVPGDFEAFVGIESAIDGLKRALT